MTRVAVVAVAVVLAAAEAYLALRYAALGALFHYWLHGLTGVAAGLVVVAAARLWRPGERRRPNVVTVLAAAAGGRLFFALPDVLFLAAELPHAFWMDVFGGHIAVHFVPAPLAVAFAVFVLGVVAAALAMSDRARAGAATGMLALGVLAAAFALRAPLPRTLDEVRDDPGLAVRCVLPAQRAAWAGGVTHDGAG